MLLHCIVVNRELRFQPHLNLVSMSTPQLEPTPTIPPLSTEEEGVYPVALDVFTPTILPPDAIIHTRITNDERALRRVVKKFHNYASLAHTPLLPHAHSGSVDDAREAFLVELASFELALKKSLMVCDAESRQVEEYQRERRRIGKYAGLLERFSTYHPSPRAGT